MTAVPDGTPPPQGGVLPDGTPATVTLVDGVDVDAVREAALACPGVADLGSGSLGAAVTYLPGRRVAGLRVLDDAVEIEVRIRLDSAVGIGLSGPTAADVAGRIRRAVGPYTGGKRVDVVITDVVL